MRKRLLGIALVVSGLFACGETAPGVQAATMGTPATRDGIFEFTVTSLDRSGGASTIGITVHNLTITARTPGISFARAYDATDGAYLPDAVRQLQVTPSLLDVLGPDARIATRLVFDVPADRALTSVVLRESPSSPGITVSLT